jgi:Transposase IS66 family
MGVTRRSRTTWQRVPPVNYIDETSWFCDRTLHWLWVMVSERVTFYMIHPRHSKEVFAALIDDWEGILISDGYGWTAPPARTVRNLAPCTRSTQWVRGT